MIKVLITGGKGQLGQSFQSISNKFVDINISFTDVEDLNICDIDNIRDFISDKDYNYIINCAAYTAVDKAESDKIASLQLNAEAVKNIGIVAKEFNIPVIHISTDYVFDGNSFKPYTENDYAVPSSYYGQTKLLGEKYLLEEQPNSIIIRTAWLYSEFGNNFVKTMIKLGNDRDLLKVVVDQVGSPTYAVDLAEGILNIILKIENKSVNFTPGIYHFSNEGVCSWYDFTINIHQLMGIDCNVLPIESKEYPTAAPRPYYSVLNKTKIKTTYKIEIPYWRFSLEKCLRKLATKN
ncbi:dTDP-4-dehydrorhamnose reductase [Plebeiibacterium sediminum]|uniref:dTDP-4-dehydrorhamnose reductase n=1 Tax=Plebeiibacterium sediminum TaxID=2992112 RepID=A0AAE3M3N4_9BACT|nr:dTDP-4-dehydrorhamnose reductase [Plebeiobacterium sediminum]MCW3786488.1 dTDP-4-dehydrorhamnose reductase [Plebeiobacterium sediminum]